MIEEYLKKSIIELLDDCKDIDLLYVIKDLLIL